MGFRALGFRALGFRGLGLGTVQRAQGNYRVQLFRSQGESYRFKLESLGPSVAHSPSSLKH